MHLGEEANFSECREDTFCLHLNEIDVAYISSNNDNSPRKSTPLRDNAQPRDPRNQEVITELVKYCGFQRNKDPIIFRGFPRRSTLTEKQHIMCLNAIRILKAKPDIDASCTEIKHFKELESRILEENAEFDAFVRNNFMLHGICRKKMVLDECEALLVSEWKSEIKMFLEKNDLLYRLQTALPSKFSKQAELVKIKHDKRIYETTFAEEEVSMKHVRAVIQATSKINFQEIFCKMLLENDTFIEESIMKHSKIESELCNSDYIVVSLDVFKMFLNGFHNSVHDWNISLSICNHNSDSKRIIRLVALPKMAMSSQARLEQIVQECVKGAFLQHQLNKVDYNLEPKEELSNTRCDNTGKHYKIATFSEYMERYYNSHCSSKRKHQRFRMDVVEIESREMLKLGVVGNLLDNISIKVEYQPEFGAGQMLLHELISEWLYLQFSNRKYITRFRIDHEMKKSLQMRKINLAEINQDLKRLYSVNSNDLLIKIYQILEQISVFPSGNYLLSYTSAKNHIISVHTSVNSDQIVETNLLNLISTYESISFERPFLEEVDWTPIDGMEITTIHVKSNIAPKLFPYWGENRQIHLEVKRKQPEEPNHLPKKKHKKTKKKKARELNKKHIAKSKLPKSTQGQASFSPDEIFDYAGQVKISDFTIVSKQDMSTDCNIEPINLTQYENEAALYESSDSLSSTKKENKR